MSHFYLTLPSNASMKCYEENTAAKYTTKIPNTIDLNGDWEVALSEIIYPSNMQHFVYGDDCRARVFMRGVYQTDILLPDEEYHDPAALIDDLINISGSYFKLNYNEKTGTIDMKCDHPFSSFIFSPTLARVLGFKQLSFVVGKSYHGEVSLGVDPSAMYVYCDLIEHVTVGDSLVPLLRTFGIEKKKSSTDVVHRTFSNLVYVPVQKKQFDTIEINIMTDTGEAVPFAPGKSVVLLHFRRCSNPYFLLQR